MTRYVLALMAIVFPAVAYAQQVPPLIVDDAAFVVAGPYFFSALVAGILLAVAFQLVLTTLSGAIGLNAMSQVTSPEERAEDREKELEKERERAREGKPPEKKDEIEHPYHRKARIFSSAFGAWTLITTAISLFFAAWLAVSLSLTGSFLLGAVMGLAIWGLFYIASMALQATLVTSAIGTMTDIARAGLQTGYEAITGIFSKSAAAHAADSAHEIAAAVREEFLGSKTLETKLRDYVKVLKPLAFDPTRMRRELAKLLNETELQAVINHPGPFVDTDTLVASLNIKGGLSREEAKEAAGAARSAIDMLREEASADKDNASKVIDATMRMAGMSADEAHKTRERIEQYLRETGREELNPEAIKHDLEEMFRHPRQGAESLRNRLQHVDRGNMIDMLSEAEHMSREDAERIVNRVEQAVDMISGNVEAATESARNKIKEYLDSFGKPELRYEGFEHDIKQLFSDPAAGADSLRRRLKSLDRDAIKAIIASRTDMSEEDIEHLVGRMEHIRDEAVHDVERVADEVRHRVAQAEHEALEQADEVRKTAATAAWWSFATAAVSGAAAALGGIVAVATMI